MSNFTKPQDDALDRAYKILVEHFDGAVISVCASTEIDGKECEAAKCTWSGGYAQAIGLAHYASRHIMEADKPKEEP